MGIAEKLDAKAASGRRASPRETKTTISLRIDAEIRQLIDSAADALGKTRTEFMIDVAQRQATDVLLDKRLFALSGKQYDAFVSALDNPPEPGPKLRALLQRKPIWQR